MNNLIVLANVTISLNVPNNGNLLNDTIVQLDAINRILSEHLPELHAEIFTSTIRNDDVEINPF